MFTTFDKAIVGLIMGAVFIAQSAFKVDLSWISEGQISTLIGLLTPLFIYFFPNKKA